MSDPEARGHVGDPEARGHVGDPEARPSKARLFVALALPEEARTALAAWRDREVGGFGALRPVAPEALHVTLCFLGWLGLRDADGIARACRVAAGDLPPVRLECEQVVWLPPRRPGVLAVALADLGPRSLAAVQASLSAVLAEGRFYVPERRPFLAHVTVARVRRGARIRPVAIEPPAIEPFQADRVVLYRSHPGPGGSRYEELAATALEGT